MFELRPASLRTAALPVLVGLTVAVVGWSVGTVAVVRITLGSADVPAGRTGVLPPAGLSVAQALVAAVALAAGGLVCRRLLLAAHLRPGSARRVAAAATAVTGAVPLGAGLLAGPPAVAASGLLAAGVVAGVAVTALARVAR